VPTLTFETTVDAPRQRVFDLARSVDCHTDGMASHDERAVAGTATGLLADGDRVTWRARHFGVPLRLTVAVSELDRPRRFVDEQVSGPFARLRHEDRFEAVADGTRMRDRFEFASPVGPVGAAVDALVLGGYMRRLVRSRLDHLARVAESEEWRRYLPNEE
jgi:ligand-binding SRPBCC domain-containing protein